MEDVLCVPELSYNLVSVPKTTEKGVMVSFEDSMCHIFDKKKREIAMATKSGRLYYIEGIYQSVNTDEKGKGNLWHRHYAHLSAFSLQKLAK